MFLFKAYNLALCAFANALSSFTTLKTSPASKLSRLFFYSSGCWFPFCCVFPAKPPFAVVFSLTLKFKLKNCGVGVSSLSYCSSFGYEDSSFFSICKTKSLDVGPPYNWICLYVYLILLSKFLASSEVILYVWLSPSDTLLYSPFAADIILLTSR